MTTKTCLVLMICMANGLMRAEPMVGGFAARGGGERVERVVGNALPVWREEAGVYLEVSGRFVAAGEGSVVLRVADEKRPLTLVWSSTGSWQLLAPGALPRDFSTQEMTSDGESATWRLRVRGLQRPLQRAELWVLSAGGWQVVCEKDVALPEVREWVEEGGVLTVGVAGAAGLEDANVRVVREGVLFMVK